jgi:prolyl oligopeptidase
MRRLFPLGVLLLGGLLVIGNGTAADAPQHYPDTKRIDHVDEYHGVKVPDPYRWLEDDVRKSEAVKQWVEAQNRLTEEYLKGIPERDKIRQRLTELWNYARQSAPSKHGSRYFFSENDGLQNQAVLYVSNRLGGDVRVLLDPNRWSRDGTIALGDNVVSDDGAYLAYSINDAGSDWKTWHVLDVESGKTLGDELKWSKYSTATWTKDNRGFYYGRFPEPKAGAEFQDLNKNHQLMYHRVGTPQSDDELIYSRPDQPDWSFSATASEDGRYLIITIAVGTDDRYRVVYRDLAEPKAKNVDLIDNFDNDFSFIENDGPIFYFKTDWKAPRGRVIAIDIRKPERANWKEIIPQANENLTGIGLVGNQFVAEYLKDAHSQVKMFTPEGAFIREVEFPTIGTASGFTGKRTDTETFYTFTSFNMPPTIYRYDLLTGKSTVFRQSKAKVNPDDFEVKQVFYTSKDGTKVPMFITAKKGLKLDGSNPTLLYGYGGFNISLTPGFTVPILVWLEMGGVYAVPSLRGGGEYGQEWHKAGTKLHKQNVFDDFIAAAEYLIKEKYTRPDRLAIRGGSNGGLLVGAVLTQRPDLFGAALPHVGVMDMLRFQNFTAGRFWVDDYGSSENPEEFKAHFAYSPYHNIKKGTKYPATMVLTADTDDRVVPGHSFKFLAALQHAQGGDAPILGRIETRAGHGAGKPTAKIIDEYADEWAFLVKNLHMRLP